MKALKTLIITLMGISSFAQEQENVIPEFKTILDQHQVEGSIVIFDVQENAYYSNDFKWAKQGFIPASTFKIPNTIIALELGIVKDEKTVLHWNGEKRNLPAWEKDLTLTEAFQASCVPCYQDIALQIGEKRMKSYLTKLNYPKMIFNKASLNYFWLQGESKISPMEQIEFLNRFYFSELPISERTTALMKKVMVMDKNEMFTLSAKTGLGMRDKSTVGWYVGYLEKEHKVYFFATNITPKNNGNTPNFNAARIDTTLEALRFLKVIENQ